MRTSNGVKYCFKFSLANAFQEIIHQQYVLWVVTESVLFPQSKKQFVFGKSCTDSNSGVLTITDSKYSFIQQYYTSKLLFRFSTISQYTAVKTHS